jgi:hypothetical protein
MKFNFLLFLNFLIKKHNYPAAIAMFADETISALTLARLHVALIAGRALAVATAFCLEYKNFIFGNFFFFVWLRFICRIKKTGDILTLAGAFRSVAIVTGSAQLARMTSRPCFAFKALTSESVAPIRRPDFVIAAAVARLAKTSGHQRITIVTVSAPVIYQMKDTHPGFIT